MPPVQSVIFDIETVDDRELMARVGYEPKKDAFRPIPFHLPVAIAIGEMSSDGVLMDVYSLGDGLMLDDPAYLTELFWWHISHAPMCISFNGADFDFKVMELCALRYGVVCAKHWSDERYGTRDRYSKAHIDLFQKLKNTTYGLSGYKVDYLVQMLGYNGKGGMDGSQVQQYWDEGRLEEIRSYNRRDVICNFALWLAYAFTAGKLTEPMYQAALSASKPFLDQIR